MIKDHDRSGWIGASDTHIVMGSWQTAGFRRWFAIKLGLATNTYTNRYMQTGTHFEHKILDALGIKRRDRQIRIKKLRLRVNLDGEDRAVVHEIKTHKSPKFKVTRAYWQQAQVEMFATGKQLVIDAYRLLPEDYENYFREINLGRHTEHPVPYDAAWIEQCFLPRVRVLADAIKKGVFPE
ncbi:MAG: hypothetical protein E7663_07775 [Ruminococcaceae bacterium]|nr:hypothetical protein [Oscillospiraceae bacterium]